MLIMMFSRFLFCWSLLILRYLNAAAQKRPESVALYFHNEADVSLTLSWLNVFQRNVLVPQKNEPVVPHSGINIDSYIGHSFVASRADLNLQTFNPHDKANQDIDAVFFTMSPWDDTVIVKRAENGTLIYTKTNSFTKTTEFMAEAANKCEIIENTKIPSDALSCISEKLASDVASKDRNLRKQRKLLTTVGDRLRNYTCADPLLDTTNNYIRTFVWEDKSTAYVYLDEPAAKIMLIDNFVNDIECDAIMDAAEGKLQAATVNGANGADLSVARRAKAGPAVPTHEAGDGVDPITDLYRRGYRFANELTGYDLPVEYQEHFSVIKYDPSDEYISHCDGDCTGTPYRTGGRVSTMVIYCEAAEIGGGTTFSNVDVFIKGKRGQAAFFSYYDKEKDITDDGLTRHSGCPIISGTKWIATLWMRKGVTKEKNHMFYDPEGRPTKKANALTDSSTINKKTVARGESKDEL